MPQTRAPISSPVSFRLGLTTFCALVGVALPLSAQVDWRALAQDYAAMYRHTIDGASRTQPVCATPPSPGHTP